MLLNRNLIDNAMCSDNESDADGAVMSVLPIHHIYCFTCDILLSLRYGSQLCINDSLMHLAQNLTGDNRAAYTLRLVGFLL